MRTFVGYYCLGATTKEDALAEKGFCLWYEVKPNSVRRFLMLKLLGFFWVDKSRTVGGNQETNGKSEKPLQTNPGTKKKVGVMQQLSNRGPRKQPAALAQTPVEETSVADAPVIKRTPRQPIR